MSTKVKNVIQIYVKIECNYFYLSFSENGNVLLHIKDFRMNEDKASVMTKIGSKIVITP